VQLQSPFRPKPILFGQTLRAASGLPQGASQGSDLIFPRGRADGGKGVEHFPKDAQSRVQQAEFILADIAGQAD
jgi:hypothetical protein